MHMIFVLGRGGGKYGDRGYGLLLVDVSVGWYPGSIDTHRNVAKHGHGGHDHLFYVMRYKGFYSCAMVTCIAPALCLLKAGFKNSETKVEVLVFAQNWDWETLFKSHISKFMRWSARPLAWKYMQSTDGDARAMSRYQDWGALRVPVCLRTSLPACDRTYLDPCQAQRQ